MTKPFSTSKKENKKVNGLTSGNLVHCAFHPSEGCGDCLYSRRCSIKEDGWFI